MSVLIRAVLPSANPPRAVAIIIGAATAGIVEILMLPEVLTERADRLKNRAHVASRVSPADRDAFLALLLEIGVPTPPFVGSFPSPVRDTGDDYLLADALRDRADNLVTGDRDLLDLAVRYVTPRIVDPEHSSASSEPRA